jgi:hypothetical protein
LLYSNFNFDADYSRIKWNVSPCLRRGRYKNQFLMFFEIAIVFIFPVCFHTYLNLTPMAGAIAHRQEYRLVLGFYFFATRIPINGVVDVLKKVWGFFVD